MNFCLGTKYLIKFAAKLFTVTILHTFSKPSASYVILIFFLHHQQQQQISNMKPKFWNFFKQHKYKEKKRIKLLGIIFILRKGEEKTKK